jgi:type II secretory ATPase GspE/PulE/Tfp pilus assembly ATPase PilB-like protein
MRNYVVAHGERSMREDGLFKARAGMTTIDEVMRVTSYQEDHEV